MISSWTKINKIVERGELKYGVKMDASVAVTEGATEHYVKRCDG